VDAPQFIPKLQRNDTAPVEWQCVDSLLIDRCIPALAGEHQVGKTKVKDVEYFDNVTGETDEIDSDDQALQQPVLARSVEEKSMSELQLADQDIGPVLRPKIQSDKQPMIDELLVRVC